MGWYCLKCGGNHPVHLHNSIVRPSDTPLETPSHNGKYQGTVKVRTVLPGASGYEWTNPQKYAIKETKIYTITCKECGAEKQTKQKTTEFCSRKCQFTANNLRRRMKHAKKKKAS